MTDKPHYCAPGECRKFATWPPPMHPNEIDAAFYDMRNRGQSYIGRLWQSYIGRLSGPPISLREWRENELKRWQSHAGQAELAEAEFYLARRDKG